MKEDDSLDEDKMCTWQEGDLVLAGQESRECCIFISDVGTCLAFICL